MNPPTEEKLAALVASDYLAVLTTLHGDDFVSGFTEVITPFGEHIQLDVTLGEYTIQLITNPDGSWMRTIKHAEGREESYTGIGMVN